MRPRAIDLHIERLVLEGLDLRDGDMVATALEGELARRLGLPGATIQVAEHRHIDRLDAGAVAIPRNDGGAAAGRSVAVAVDRGLRG